MHEYFNRNKKYSNPDANNLDTSPSERSLLGTVLFNVVVYQRSVIFKSGSGPSFHSEPLLCIRKCLKSPDNRFLTSWPVQWVFFSKLLRKKNLCTDVNNCPFFTLYKSTISNVRIFFHVFSDYLANQGTIVLLCFII